MLKIFASVAVFTIFQQAAAPPAQSAEDVLKRARGAIAAMAAVEYDAKVVMSLGPQFNFEAQARVLIGAPTALPAPERLGRVFKIGGSATVNKEPAACAVAFDGTTLSRVDSARKTVERIQPAQSPLREQPEFAALLPGVLDLAELAPTGNWVVRVLGEEKIDGVVCDTLLMETANATSRPKGPPQMSRQWKIQFAREDGLPRRVEFNLWMKAGTPPLATRVVEISGVRILKAAPQTEYVVRAPENWGSAPASGPAAHKH